MSKERLRTLEYNEKFIAEGGAEPDDDAIESDDEGSDIDEDDENQKENQAYENLKKGL